jgi:hypothetical protein
MQLVKVSILLGYSWYQSFGKWWCSPLNQH